MSVDFCPVLQGLARRMGAVGAGMQHRAAIAQPRNAGPVQKVGIDTSDLGCAVRSQPQHATRQLVHQLERLEIKCLAGAGQQGLQMLQHGRHYELVAVASRHVQQISTDFFDVARLGRQYIGNVIGQDPGGHGKTAVY